MLVFDWSSASDSLSEQQRLKPWNLGLLWYRRVILCVVYTILRMIFLSKPIKQSKNDTLLPESLSMSRLLWDKENKTERDMLIKEISLGNMKYFCQSTRNMFAVFLILLAAALRMAMFLYVLAIAWSAIIFLNVSWSPGVKSWWLWGLSLSCSDSILSNTLVYDTLPAKLQTFPSASSLLCV